MIELDAKASARRRRIAFGFLAIGAVVVVATVGKDYPRAQSVVFRTPDTREAVLTATFTKVGEAEARTGFTLALPDHRSRDVSHTVHVPDGDYIVTIDIRHPKGSDAGVADAPQETSVARRVSLTGSEVVVPVPVPSRASE